MKLKPGLFDNLEGWDGEGNGNRLQYSCLENPMDRGAWQATVHGVAKSQTEQLTHIYTCTYTVGWDGMGDRREVQGEGTYIYLQLIHVDIWQKQPQYCKKLSFN